VFGILALICIIFGFVTGLFDADLQLRALEWFVAAIAFNTLSVVIPRFKRAG
jgi:uncharacterized membrane protein YiaA